MERRGRLIVLDGIDGAGKATQTAKLVERLAAEGYAPMTIEFPQYYDGFFGPIIAAYLREEYGPPRDISPFLSGVVYAANRWEHRQTIERGLAAGQIIIADRYASSNVTYSAARLPPRQRASYRKWVEELEYRVFGVPREDLICYLAVPTDVSVALIGKKRARSYLKGQRRDANERDHRYLATVAREYEHYCRTHPNARRVACTKAGTLLTIEEIHERIWRIVKPMLPRRRRAR